MKTMLMWKGNKRRKKEEGAKGFEHCVLCRKALSIRADEPITERQFYIQGVGQLCEDCYQTIQQDRNGHYF